MIRRLIYGRWRKDAMAIFRAALYACDPLRVIPRALHVRDKRIFLRRHVHTLTGPVWVFGAGKASARMAQAVEALLEDRIAGGLVIVKDGHAVPLQRIEVMEGAHPVPDDRCVRATREMVARLRSVASEDLVLFLLSGGASALLEWPREPLDLHDLQEVTEALLHSRATIHEINAVRKHLSRVKGGQLLRYTNADHVWTLIISDVVGNRLDVIGSGPTVPDISTYRDAVDVLQHYHLWERMPARVHEVLDRGCRGELEDTPGPRDPLFRNTVAEIVADNQRALQAAATEARKRGYHPLILSSSIEGETHEVARVLTAIARQVVQHQQPVRAPACLLMGGETTLEVRGSGRGGRNQEFALFAGTLLQPGEPVVIVSAGTDGTDGPTDAAGAVIDVRLMHEAHKRGLDPNSFLVNNDAYHFLKEIDALIFTGPTYTNVMDVMLAIVGGH